MGLKVYCLCHGKTKEHGNAPETYDADLTEEAVEKLQQLEIPEHDLALCGVMIRHKATAKAVGITDCVPAYTIGNDEVMFAIVEGNQVLADIIWDFFQNLNQQRDGQSILVITSRFLPVLFMYYQNGGIAKYGFFNDFSQRIENGENIDGITMPASGAITEVIIGTKRP